MSTKLTQLFLILSLMTTTSLFATFANTEKLLNQAKKEVGEIEPKKLKAMLDKGEAVIVLDIRESEERSEGEIYADETYAVTRGNLEFEIGNMIKDKNALIVAYCRGGSKSAFAAQRLRALGYKNATSLKGGLKGWAQAGYPVETGLGTVVLSKEEE